MAKNGENYTKTVIGETLSEREKQVEGVKRAFSVVFDEYAAKCNGDLPDLTESTVSKFVAMRPELYRALMACNLVNSNEWADIALSVLQERMMAKRSNVE